MTLKKSYMFYERRSPVSRKPTHKVPNPDANHSLAIALNRRVAIELKRMDPNKSYSDVIEQLLNWWQETKKNS